jgi:hypothetical protein
MMDGNRIPGDDDICQAKNKKTTEKETEENFLQIE